MSLECILHCKYVKAIIKLEKNVFIELNECNAPVW